MGDSFTLPDSPAEIVVWVVALAVIVGLYLVLARTRRASERAYWERRKREGEMRANDPDLKKD